MTDRRPQGVSSEVRIRNAVEDRPQNIFIHQMKYWDVVFTFQNLPNRIEAHELYLKARSPVFKQMFRKRKSGDASGNHRVYATKFIYKDKFEVNSASGALGLLRLATTYQVKSLITKCEELLKADINTENSIHTFETARRYGHNDLVARTGEVLAKSVADLIENEALVHAEESTLIYLLKRDDLYVQEVKLFELILKWGKSRVSASAGNRDLQEKLKNVIPLIRYTNMTPQEFTAMVYPARLLSTEDMLSVHSYATGNEAMRNSMQMKFNTTPRNKVAFVDFFAGSTCQSVRREQISVNPLKLCISFQVQPLNNVSANNGLKKPAIKAIKVKWPSRSVSNMRDDPRIYVVFVKECSGPVDDQNVSIRFQKALRNCEVGKEDEIPVEPAVELKPGVTYLVIVEDQSKPDRDRAHLAVEYVYSGKFNPYELRQNASVDLGCVDLQLTEIQRENRLPGFTHYNAYFTVNVIRGIKIDQV